MSQTIFDRLRVYHTEGQPLSELIAEACDAGDDLVGLLQTLEWGDEERPGCPFCGMSKRTGHLGRCQLSTALARAYATNGDSNGNGARAA